MKLRASVALTESNSATGSSDQPKAFIFFTSSSQNTVSHPAITLNIRRSSHSAAASAAENSPVSRSSRAASPQLKDIGADVVSITVTPFSSCMDAVS